MGVLFPRLNKQRFYLTRLTPFDIWPGADVLLLSTITTPRSSPSSSICCSPSLSLFLPFSPSAMPSRSPVVPVRTFGFRTSAVVREVLTPSTFALVIRSPLGRRNAYRNYQEGARGLSTPPTTPHYRVGDDWRTRSGDRGDAFPICSSDISRWSSSDTYHSWRTTRFCVPRMYVCARVTCSCRCTPCTHVRCEVKISRDVQNLRVTGLRPGRQYPSIIYV